MKLHYRLSVHTPLNMTSLRCSTFLILPSESMCLDHCWAVRGALLFTSGREGSLVCKGQGHFTLHTNSDTVIILKLCKINLSYSCKTVIPCTKANIDVVNNSMWKNLPLWTWWRKNIRFLFNIPIPFLNNFRANKTIATKSKLLQDSWKSYCICWILSTYACLQK